MSILHATERIVPASRKATDAPYQAGDRVAAMSPEGVRFLVRVEAVTPTESGQFTLLGAVTSPRRYRSHLLSTTVGADGFGRAIRPAV